jgi:cytochrome c biogenesis protein CcmG/thiol:disulfide interchange protein DsbE
VTVAQAKRLASTLVIVGVLMLIGTLAFAEYRARGTSGVGGINVANYAAHAEIQAGPAPDFTLPSLANGQPISMSSFRGHVTVLNFWATWCAPCRLEAPGLESTWAAYRSKGVRFLGVDERDNDPAGRAFVAEFKIGYPSVSDPPGRLAYPYRLFGMPTTFVIDASGNLRYRFVGYLDAPVLQTALDAVLAKATP